MASPQPSSAKTCVVCGQDCAGRPRVKDQNGHYYCRECHESQKEKRAAEAAPPTPTARPAVPPVPRPARPATPPPVPARSNDDGGFGLLDAIGEAESNAQGLPQEQILCPSCQMPLPAGTVVCLRCGFNRQLGRRMAPAKVETTPQATASGRPAPRAHASGGGGFLDGKEWMAGAIPAAVILVLFFLAKSNQGMVMPFVGLAGIFSLAVLVLTLVGAFKESVGQGFLCLCVPCYVLYWVYGKNENAALKWAFAAHMLGSVLARLLDMKDAFA